MIKREGERKEGLTAEDKMERQKGIKRHLGWEEGEGKQGKQKILIEER